MPDLRMVLLPHPIQLLDADELDRLADSAVTRVLQCLQPS